MFTHAEYLCPPPFVAHSQLNVFSSVMIMISLSVKCKCRFTSIFPDKPFGKKASLYCSGRRRGTFLKENTLNRRQTISFLSSARLCHALIHLFMRNIMHVDPPALATTPRHDYVIPADSPSNTCCP